MNGQELSQRRQDALSAILGLSPDITIGDFQQQVLQELTTAFSATSSCFFVYRDERPYGGVRHGLNSTLDFDRMVSINLDGATKPLYQERYASLDPFIFALASLGARIAPLAINDPMLIRGDTPLHETEFYADFMVPRDVHHVLCLRLVDGHRNAGLVSLYRSVDQPSFNRLEVAQAALFAPTLTSGLARIRLGAMALGYEYLIDALERKRPDLGVISINDQGGWQDISPTMEGWLGYGSGEARRRFQRDIDYLIRHAMQDGDARKLGDGAGIGTVHRGDGVAVKLSVIVPQRPVPQCVRLVLAECDEAEDRIAANAERFGLSQRQLEVARLVADGHRSAEIADRLCISHTTVNNHIQALYRKTGVATRARFVRAMTAA